ncbi:hypothetical protein HK096_009151 [Nowakowskiella sp. JEL0078]|nr:hypothetical protein HK096_009151 [Nowakowskiella sp. JEL0078]
MNMENTVEIRSSIVTDSEKENTIKHSEKWIGIFFKWRLSAVMIILILFSSILVGFLAWDLTLSAASDSTFDLALNLLEQNERTFSEMIQSHVDAAKSGAFMVRDLILKNRIKLGMKTLRDTHDFFLTIAVSNAKMFSGIYFTTDSGEMYGVQMTGNFDQLSRPIYGAFYTDNGTFWEYQVDQEWNYKDLLYENVDNFSDSIWVQTALRASPEYGKWTDPYSIWITYCLPVYNETERTEYSAFIDMEISFVGTKLKEYANEIGAGTFVGVFDDNFLPIGISDTELEKKIYYNNGGAYTYVYPLEELKGNSSYLDFILDMKITKLSQWKAINSSNPFKQKVVLNGTVQFIFISEYLFDNQKSWYVVQFVDGSSILQRVASNNLKTLIIVTAIIVSISAISIVFGFYIHRQLSRLTKDIGKLTQLKFKEVKRIKNVKGFIPFRIAEISEIEDAFYSMFTTFASMIKTNQELSRIQTGSYSKTED